MNFPEQKVRWRFGGEPNMGGIVCANCGSTDIAWWTSNGGCNGCGAVVYISGEVAHRNYMSQHGTYRIGGQVSGTRKDEFGRTFVDPDHNNEAD